VPDGFLEDWEFDGKPRHFSDKFSGYSVFVSERNPQFKASLMFARMLGNQMAARDQQFARQYDQLFMGKYQHQLLDLEAGVYRYDELIVLRQTMMPAVLLEAGSIINRDEELVMASPEYRDLVSAAVSSAVTEFCDARTLPSRGLHSLSCRFPRARRASGDALRSTTAEAADRLYS